jgi:hypothetical protein
MVAESGVHMSIHGNIDQGGHVIRKKRGGKIVEKEAPNSGVASRKEVEDTINIRCVANVSQLHVKIDESVEVIHFHGKSWSIRKMVDKGVDFAQVDGIGKNFFHVRFDSLMKSI